jgi:hypothetical protein
MPNLRTNVRWASGLCVICRDFRTVDALRSFDRYERLSMTDCLINARNHTAKSHIPWNLARIPFHEEFPRSLRRLPLHSSLPSASSPQSICLLSLGTRLCANSAWQKEAEQPHLSISHAIFVVVGSAPSHGLRGLSLPLATISSSSRCSLRAWWWMSLDGPD